jgi:hypothetical protein
MREHANRQGRCRRQASETKNFSVFGVFGALAVILRL